MPNRMLILVILLAIPARAANKTWQVDTDGVGPVKIGMTLSQLRSTLHEKLVVPKRKDSQGCFYVKHLKHPDIDFMIEAGRLVRVDARKPGTMTTEGVQVGDSEDQVLKIYGSRVQTTAAKYVEEGHYFTIRSDDGARGIRFETDGKKVETFYAGEYSAIQLVEGCS